MGRSNKERTTKSCSEADATSEDEITCGNCEQLLSAKVGSNKSKQVNNVLECEICIRWFHTICVNVSDEQYTMLVDNDFHWFCHDCDAASKQLYKRVTALQAENTKLKQELNTLTTKVATINTKVTTVETSIDTKITEANRQLKVELQNKIGTENAKLKNEFNHKLNQVVAPTLKADLKAELLNELQTDIKIQNLREEFNARLNAAPITPDDADDREGGAWQDVNRTRRTRNNQQQMQSEINEAIEEKARIEKRKKNLIATNIPESNAAGADRTKLEYLIRNKLNINEDIIITDITRLGTRIANKDRMLRFTLEDLRSKKLILSKATTLRHLEEGDDYYKVYVKPDLTPKQAEASKNLVAELKKTREENHPRKYKIYRGSIVELNEDGEILQ